MKYLCESNVNTVVEEHVSSENIHSDFLVDEMMIVNKLSNRLKILKTLFYKKCPAVSV